MAGKCPHCPENVTTVDVGKLTINAGPHRQIAGMSYICPKCQTVLGVSMDPLVMMDEIIKRVRSEN